MRSVLIIEDNSTMLRGLKDNFELKGYSVRTAQDGETGLRKALGDNPDLIILDIMVPRINGYEVCNNIRKKHLDMPIIMLTARNRESDVIMGLNLGADDYVTKPFSIRELLARAEAFMRRRAKEEPVVYEFGNYRLDTLSNTLTCGNEEIILTPGEFRILQLFLRRAGCTLTCDEIRNSVWGCSHFITVRDIENAVRTLRNKIEDEPDNPRFIRTVEEIGYKFVLPEEDGNNTDSRR